MSYENLGALKAKPGRYSTTAAPKRRGRTFASAGVAMRRAVPAERTTASRRYRRQIPSTYGNQALDGYLVNRADALDGLGFSIKPPKKVRKAVASVARTIKKNVTLKRALIAGAIVGGAIVAGPAMLSAARVALPAAARGAGKVVRGAGGLIGRGAKGVANLLKPGQKTAAPDGILPQYGPQPVAPPQVQPMGPQSGMEASAMRAAASQADRLDQLDESDALPLQSVSQNGEQVEVAAGDTEAASTAPPAASAAPAIHPAIVGIGGLLLWGLANAPRRH